jgi:hypothetical protein
MNIARKGAISLQTVVCNISPLKKKSLRTIAMLDSGSNVTLIDSATAKRLDLEVLIGDHPRSFSMARGTASLRTKLVRVPLTSVNLFNCTHIDALTMDNLTENTGVVDWSVCKNNFEHLKDVPFPPLPEDARITLLIGGEYTELFAADRDTQRIGKKGDPYAYHSFLGWTAFGRSSPPDPEEVELLHTIIQNSMPR